MDHKLLVQIERQKVNEETRKTEFDCQLHEAHKMWNRAAAELQAANAAAVQSSDNLRAYAILENARAVERATSLNLHQLYNERNLKF